MVVVKMWVLIGENKEDVKELKFFLAPVFRPLMDMKPTVSRYRPDARPQAFLSYLA